jgi:ABC-2 type transport system permease protein
MTATVTAPRGAFGQIVRNEARLAWRQPAGLIAGVGISLGLLIMFGEVSAFRQSSARLDGLTTFEIYLPILIAFSIGAIALIYLPGPLVSYREQGILRRMSTTPAPASWVLAAQLVVQACAMVFSLLVLLIVSIVFFGASAPKNVGGLILAIVLSIAAMFTIGLTIAAMARTAGAARGILAAVFYPLMFFAGLYYPVQLMPGIMLGISHLTPLGASVQALVYSIYGGFPPVQSLLVLAGYSLIFGYLARRLFRWE